jgi:hypothetical protein
MRATILTLATIIGFAVTAHADVRHASIPESLWGKWAASADDCGKADTASVVLSAKQYVSPDRNCSVGWVIETPGGKAPFYSAHLECAAAGAPAGKAISNVILRQNDDNQISMGADFNSLKDYRRCAPDR